MRGSGAPRTGPAPPDRSAAALGKFWAHRWAYSVFVPKPYTGFVALFTSEQLASERPAPGRGWRRWAKSLHEYTLPGTHGSCIRGEKGALVEKFHECLKAANGQEPS